MNIMTKTPLDCYFLLLYFVGCIFFETGGLKMKYLGTIVFIFLVSLGTISSVPKNAYGIGFGTCMLMEQNIRNEQEREKAEWREKERVWEKERAEWREKKRNE